MPRSFSHAIKPSSSRIAVICSSLLILVGMSAPAAPVAGRTTSITGNKVSGVATQAATAQQQAAVDQAYGKLPLAFEVNAGQADASARFLTHTAGYSLALGPGGATLALAPSPTSVQPRGAALGSALSDPALRLSRRSTASNTLGPVARFDGAALGMTWLGANPNARVTGEDKLSGIVNYFLGNDPSKWRSSIATYARVRYHDLYPGIDLVYYGGADGQLEYDFVVQPGADPAQIRLAYSGSQRLHLDEQGNLQLTLTDGRTIAQQAPGVYQSANGTRQLVAGGYLLVGDGSVGFHLGAYNPTLPLVIDPVYRFGTYLGGSTNGAYATGITIDTSGNAYITGNAGADFPTTPGSYHTTSFGAPDAFVAELNAAGTALIYSTFLGGSSSDFGNGIAVDLGGNVYVNGYTYSHDFPTTVGAFQRTFAGAGACGGCLNSFVTKLNAAGSALVYSTYLGGNGMDFAGGLTIDGSGNVYVTGTTTSTTFPVKNAFQSTLGGGTNSDAYVTKLNATGSALVFSTYLGGNQSEGGSGIALDGSGNVYVTGSTNTAFGGFPVTSGALQTTYGGGNYDGFVTKFNPSGSSLVYSTYLGGSGVDGGNGIVVDGAGNAYITGGTYSTNFPVTTGAFQTAERGTASAFVTKLNPAGNGLVYSTYLGGGGDGIYGDSGSSITVDGAGYAYVTGTTYSSVFPVKNPVQLHSGGSQDAFLTRLNPSGSALVFSTYLGGSGVDGGAGLALGPASTVYFSGSTDTNDFPTRNALEPTGTLAGFVAKMSVLPTPVQTTGAYDPASGAYYLRTSNSSGNADIQFPFGPAGCTPLAGDWNGKGFDSIGAYCASSGTFYLRNANNGGNADFAFAFGPPNCAPLVGDWTGKNYDSVGVDCNGTFYLRNSNSAGNADFSLLYGPASGCAPVAGDWNAKGYDSVGVDCNGTFYLRNTNTAGNADFIIPFGPGGCLADTGDWTGKGYDSIGVDCAGTYYLRNSNTAGNANIAFVFGAASFKPLAGEWVPAPGSVAGHGG